MNLYYYRGSPPNFGDELNAWMWSRILPGVWNDNDDSLFLGIGSILFDFFPKDKRKIVFGAGYGGYTTLPEVDESWKFYFVRGHLTARALNLDPKLALGDAAILLRSCVETNVVKKHQISFMPHWESSLDGTWERACQLASIKYIDPTETVKNVITAILESEIVITEAMHGAIVSDALRVPWIAVTPIQRSHHMKWQDWASALDLKLDAQRIGPSSLLELALLWAPENAKLIRQLRRGRPLLKYIFPEFFAEIAATQLLAVSRVATMLSRDSMIQTAHERMLGKVDELLKDLRR